MPLDRLGYRAMRLVDPEFGQLDAQSVKLGAQMHGQSEEEAGGTEGRYTGDEHLHRLDNHERLTRRLASKHAGLANPILVTRVCVLDLIIVLPSCNRRYRHRGVNTHYDAHQDEGERCDARRHRRVLLHDPAYPLILLRRPIVRHRGDYLEQFLAMDTRGDQSREG